MSKRSRIASYCSSPAWGGLEMNVLRFLRWMQETGRPVAFYGDPASRMFQEAERQGLTPRAITPRFRTGDLWTAWKFSRRLKRDGIAALVIHRSQDLFTGVMATRMTGRNCRLIYSQHMHIGTDKHDPYHRWLYRQIDAFATPVKWLADRVLEKTSVPPERLQVVTRGIEVERYVDIRAKRSEARRRFGIEGDEPIIGLIGRLDPKKGQDVAIKALAQVHGRGIKAHLLLVGSQSFAEGDAYAHSIRSLVEELRLSRFVHFHPHTPEVESAYAALDIFVLTSKSECYGMVTIEALTSGLPVIATGDGGTLSLIDHERNGLLVKPLDADDLARALLRLLEDQYLAERLGREAAQEGRVRFSHRKQVRDWEKLLDKLGI